ncbi:MAG TPA: hypothetical protein VM470_02190 [Acidimicrobiia bacterium]|nr:hypothetical protein [Acidimicrobiia bacterium]
MVQLSTSLVEREGDRSRLEHRGVGMCGCVGLPDGHCISPGTLKNFANIVAKGLTFQLLVFDGDGDFLTAEIATFKASADNRPCPHDPDSPDGTYWPFVEGLYVCHHQAG